jgi:putative FmdB family regulatory protein
VPLYEYECAKDGTFERIQKFSDPPLTKCPTCGGPVEKLLSAPAIQFKGTGWYITDYARKGDGGGKKDEGSGKKDAGSSAKGSSDASSGSSSSSDGKSGSSASGSDKKSSGSDKK